MFSNFKSNPKNLPPPSESLEAYSPWDKPWDLHGAAADEVARIYAGSSEFERYAERMEECASFLRFGRVEDPDTGECKLKLREAHFCRVRHCPVCQWRRSLLWRFRFYQALPMINEQYSDARWLFLTLTVKNCPIDDLRSTLKQMNRAWQRLKGRKAFKPVLGWVRTTEITRGEDGSAHPHFHAVLMVPPSWFGQDYVDQTSFVELWRDCLRVDYAPSVDIRTVKALDSKSDLEGLKSAVLETLKYSVKPSDMTKDPEWFLELTRQTHRCRFIATGGVLKNILKVEKETDEELALTEGPVENQDDGSRIAFAWDPRSRRYWRAPEKDVGSFAEQIVESERILARLASGADSPP